MTYEVRPEDLPQEVIDVVRLYSDDPATLTAVAAAFTIWFELHTLRVRSIEEVAASGGVKHSFFSADYKGDITLWIVENEAYKRTVRDPNGEGMILAAHPGEVASIRMTEQMFETLLVEGRRWWKRVRNYRTRH